MFSFENGKLFRYGIKDGKVVKDESLYVHIQKRPVYVETPVSDFFSIVPPGRFVPYVKNITPFYLRTHVREGRLWTYYTLIRNKINKIFGQPAWSNTVLFPNQDM